MRAANRSALAQPYPSKPTSQADFTALIKADVIRMGKVINDTKITAE